MGLSSKRSLKSQYFPLQLALLPLLLLYLITGCAKQGVSEQVPTVVPTAFLAQKPSYTVQRGTVTRMLRLIGRVVPVQQQGLFFHTDGFVKELLVKTGDQVGVNEVLARLDDPERYNADLAAAELAFTQAQSTFEQTEMEAPINLAEAKIALEQAENELEKANNAILALNYPRVSDSLTLDKFRTDAAIAEQNLKEAQSRYDNLSDRLQTDPERAVALDALITARHTHYLAIVNLNWAEGKASQEEIDQAQVKLELAQANYDLAVAEVQRWESDSPTGELAIARLALVDAEARLALARKMQESGELKAPFAGQVLSLDIAPGGSVKAFQVVLTLADLTQLEIQAIPAAEELNLLGIGQIVTTSLSSHQGEEFDSRVSSLPIASTNLAGGNNDRAVHIALDDTAITLILGEAAMINIQVEVRKNVLWLPPAAIRSFQGQDFVFIESNGIQRRVNINLGLKSTDRVEIVEGLEEGQEIIGQ